MHYPRPLSWEWAGLGSEPASGGKCHHESLPLSWPPPALLSLGTFTWYFHWPLQAAMRATGMQTGSWHTAFGSAHMGSAQSSVPVYKTLCGSSHPLSSLPLWGLWPGCMCSPAFTVPSTFAFLMHTPHRFHTQAWVSGQRSYSSRAIFSTDEVFTNPGARP